LQQAIYPQQQQQPDEPASMSNSLLSFPPSSSEDEESSNSPFNSLLKTHLLNVYPVYLQIIDKSPQGTL